MSFVASVLRKLLGLCALVLILAALYVSLGRQLVPLVAEYRDEVQQKAQAALGVPVSIGSLEGSWRGMAPLVSAHDVLIGSGDDSIRLDRVLLVPDLLASLSHRQLRIANLDVEGLKLNLHQDEQGRWTVEGMPARDPNKPTDPQKVLQGLQSIGQLSLLDSQVTLEPHQQKPMSFTYANLTLSNGLSGQRLDARLLLPDGQPVAMQLRAHVNTEDWRRSDVQLYASLPQSDWAKLIPEGVTRDWRIERLQAGGEFWLDLRKGQVERAVARLHAPQLLAGYKTRKSVKVDDLALTAFFSRNRDDGFDVLIDSLAMSLGETRWGDTQAALQYRKADEERWRLVVDRIDLGPIGPVLHALAPLPDKAAEALDGLNPSGLLSNISMEYRPQLDNPKKLQYSANLTRVGIDAWHGVPAVANASGSVTGDMENGEGRTDSENFGLHLDHFFPEMWRYRRANGQLFWHVDSEGWSLRMPYAQLDGEEGKIAGDFLIRMYKDPARERYMDLRVGLRDGDARYTAKYLPTRSPAMSPALSEWLTTAIKGGKVDEGYFQYQGSLAKDAEPAARNISLYFRTHDAELAFQPGWPALKSVRGEVLIEPTGVRIRAPEGRILDSMVRDVTVDIPHVQQGQTTRLLINGQVDSSLPDALKILQEAPIGTADIFAGWEGEGAVDAKLKLDIPMHAGEKPGVWVDFATENARLRLSTPKLELSQVKGAFRFDLDRGLSSPDVRAQVFERPVRGKIVAEGKGGKARTRVEASGVVPVTSLSTWLGVTKPLPLSGDLPYTLGLSLDGADSQLRVSSELTGVAVDLPAPFGKAAADKGAATWRMTLQGPEQRYWFDYGGMASFAFAAPKGQVMQGRGELRLGEGSASLPTSSGLRVAGQIDELDWAAWKAVADRYVQVKDNQEAVQFFRGGDLKIAHFKGFGNDIANLQVKLARSDSGWNVGLDSDLLQGDIGLPNAQDAPLQVKLQRLSLPPPKTADEEEEADKQDPLVNIDPRDIPALDISIAQVLRGDQALGSWALKTRPTAQGVQFRDLALNLKGLQVGGAAGWEGAPGASSSWYKGRLEGKNLADVLQAWGFAPTTTSERFRMDVDGRWPGSPAWLSPKRFSGTLDASMRDGQFVEVQGASSALRVFGLLNFNSIGRRLRLDFSDLLGKGFSYDRTKGLLVADNGVFVTKEPIRIEGPSSSFELNGTLDMARDQVDAKLLVTLPVTNNLPLAALIVGAPAIGGALFVVDKLLGDKVARFASVQYKVEGAWQDPKISFDKPFQKPK